MKISENNYFDQIAAIGFENLPEELKQVHLVIMRKTDMGKDWSICEKDPEMKKAVDLAFEKLEELIWYRAEKGLEGKKEDEDPSVKQAKADAKNYWMVDLDMLERLLRMEEDAELEYGSQPDIDIRKKALKKEIKSRKKAQGMGSPAKGEFQEERQFITEFLALNNQSKSPQEILTLLESLQQAIVDKRIRKSSAFASEIKLIQDGLLETYNQMDEEPIQIRLKDQTIRRMNKALDAIAINKQQKPQALSGTNPETPATEHKPAESKIMCSTDFTQLNFNSLGFKDKWLAFIGDPVPGFTAMVFGRPKMGKSYLCVDFAGYLARNHGKVLYVSKEEKLDATLQKKLMDKDVDHVNLFVADNLPEDLTPYDFIILDSVNKLGLNPKDLEKLKADNKGKCFIFIFQTTKQGIFRGANSFQHDVDVVIEVPEQGKAVQFGRFNQGGEMNIFDEKDGLTGSGEAKQLKQLKSIPSEKVTTDIARRKITESNLKKNFSQSDNLNPQFIFNSTETQLLIEALNGEYDLNYLVRKELANRGVDAKGLWIGFNEAKLRHDVDY
jgi:hypothetical protein